MSSPPAGKARPASGGMVEAPLAEQANRPLTVGIGLTIWKRYCCYRMIGIRDFLQSPCEPIVPQARPSRCIL